MKRDPLGVRYTALKLEDAYRVWHWGQEVGMVRKVGARWSAWDGTTPYRPQEGPSRSAAVAALLHSLGRAA